MGALVRSEWTKLLTTRVWIGLLLGACAFGGGFAALFTGLAGGEGVPALGTPDYEQTVLAVAANGTVFALILGIIGVTQEYRHRTATPTFLSSPHRWRVVVAKLLAYVAAAVPFALVACAVTAVVALVYSSARGTALTFDQDNLVVLARAGLAIVIYVVIGIGLGALLRNQVGAIVGALVFLYVVEPLLGSIPATQGLYKWLPGGALSAMTSDFQAPDVLGPWQGAAILVAYGLVAAALATLLTVRRDVV
ncbi:ABC transporter permease subunit [Modestobacter sp. I12A-02628]|uniref:ABC transporter permease subunit n=1 Tax=Goekera deserti TaxID=2497753 RepID=A0A7K3W9F4_9ACTN|nr:ABC transporter permease subunit [Goekera deserti]NDI50074.1 ABC transporter permease subunit [Goekera deserti]NEL52450.1 ABC transporter permease subunit [Goekera deserti]